MRFLRYLFTGKDTPSVVEGDIDVIEQPAPRYYEYWQVEVRVAGQQLSWNFGFEEPHEQAQELARAHIAMLLDSDGDWWSDGDTWLNRRHISAITLAKYERRR